MALGRPAGNLDPKRWPPRRAEKRSASANGSEPWYSPCETASGALPECPSDLGCRECDTFARRFKRAGGSFLPLLPCCPTISVWPTHHRVPSTQDTDGRAERAGAKET